MPSIDSDSNTIKNIPFTDQGSTPTTPSSGKTRIFTKSDGLYIVNSIGTVTGPFAIASTGAAADGWASADAMTYASADSPTFTMTCSGDQTAKYSPGMRIKLTQTTVKYFIITAVSYGAPNTTITLYGGTDYTLANAAITSPYYSTAKAPGGFPLSPIKWTVEASDTTNRTTANPTANTWVNLHSSGGITIPIGVWRVSYQVSLYIYNNAAQVNAWVTLSTANNTESDADMTANIEV